MPGTRPQDVGAAPDADALDESPRPGAHAASAALFKQVEQLSKMVRQYPLPPEIAEVILATERMPGFERTFRSNLRALVRPRGPRPQSVLTEAQLSAVDQPSLLVFARQDPMGSVRAGQRMAKALPDAELHITEGGHCPWLNEPERIAGWVKRFLERTSSISPSLGARA